MLDRGSILYVGNFELPDRGASANRVVGNGKLFNLLGFRTVFLGITRDRTSLGITQKSTDMYEEPYPQNTVQWFRHMFSVSSIRAVIEKTREPDLIILYNSPYSLLCSVKRAFPNTKIVYDCTEWSDTTDGSIVKRAVKKADERNIRMKIDHVADGLIVVSTLMQRSYHNDHILLLPPLVDADDAIWRQPIEKEDDRFAFCFSGMLDGNKDSLDLIVRAFIGLTDTKTVLRIIGVKRESFFEQYPDLYAASEKLGDRLVFMGLQSHAEALRYVQNSDCNLMIRASDRRNMAGFPTKFAEAYTTGRSIITTDTSDVRTYADQWENSFVVEYNEENIRAAMEKAIVQKNAGTGLRRDFHFASFGPACEAWLSDLISTRVSSC